MDGLHPPEGSLHVTPPSRRSCGRRISTAKRAKGELLPEADVQPSPSMLGLSGSLWIEGASVGVTRC